jgi:hypothetical protein
MKSSLAVSIAVTLASLFLSGPILSGPGLAQPANPPTPTTRPPLTVEAFVAKHRDAFA